MLYHPDKNKDSEDAAEKFREITAAYEVLGNFRLRKLYDKGILHSAGEKYQKHSPSHEEEEMDPTTRFYKARMKKEHATATGRTPIYDFDEWTKSHYGGEMRRQQQIRQNFKSAHEKTTSNRAGSQLDFMLFSLFLMVLLAAIFGQRSHDIDRIAKEKLDQKEKAS